MLYTLIYFSLFNDCCLNVLNIHKTMAQLSENLYKDAGKCWNSFNIECSHVCNFLRMMLILFSFTVKVFYLCRHL